MAFTLPDNQTATGTLDLTDALGVHGATLDAPPTYSTSDPNVTATASADGMSVVIAVGAGAPSGDVQITAACVAGGNSFVIQGTVTIGAGPATGGSMNFALNS